MTGAVDALRPAVAHLHQRREDGHAGVGALTGGWRDPHQQAGAKLEPATSLVNGAHLRGAGTNATSLTVASGSTVDPGFSPGILTVGALSSSIAGGILNIELGGETAGTGYDQIRWPRQSTVAGGT